MARIPQIIVFERTREVYTFMLNGSKRTKDILHFFTKKWTDEGIFKESLTELGKHRTIHNYIRKVKDSFFDFEKEIDYEKGRQLARLEDLYSKNIKIQDYKAAKDIVKEINAMLGFNAPTKTDLTTKGESLNKDPFKEIRSNNGIDEADG